MSVFHFPVMAYAGDPHAAYHQAEHHSHHHASHLRHGDADHTIPASPAKCDGFACFLAVEPACLDDRSPHAILFGILSFSLADFLLAAAARPDLPPPRLQS